MASDIHKYNNFVYRIVHRHARETEMRFALIVKLIQRNLKYETLGLLMQMTEQIYGRALGCYVIYDEKTFFLLFIFLHHSFTK